MEPVKENLATMLDDGDGAMVTLSAGDAKLVVHRAVLAASSPVFGAMVQNGTPDACFAISNVEGPVLRQLMVYMYTLEAPQMPDMLPQLLAVADKYCLSGLKDVCKKGSVKKVPETTSADLGALLDAGDGAVVTLEAGETRLAAHRAVLAARSPVFQAMFRHDTLESSSGVVSIADIEGPVLRQLLSYVYTLQAPQLPGVAAQLLPAADKYGLSALKDVCEQQVVAQLAVETAAASAVLGVRHSCPNLTAAAVSFIKDHVFQVLATQGWADAMRNQLEDVTEVNRLLADLSAKTAATPGCSQGQTTLTAATAGAPHTPPPGDAAVSHVGKPATKGRRTSSRTHKDHSHTAASATTTTPPCLTPPPDDAAVARFRNLSAKEKGDNLLVAAVCGKVGHLRALLAAGADLRARDPSRRTVLHMAADSGQEEAVRLLVEAGAEVDARDSWRDTPLHDAARSGRTDVVRLLLTYSAEVNARNSSQQTPLHLAADHGHEEVVAALLEAGADAGARDKWGNTPLDVARNSSQEEVIDLLT